MGDRVRRHCARRRRPHRDHHLRSGGTRAHGPRRHAPRCDSKHCCRPMASACHSSRRVSARRSTIGGTIAAGLAGPARAARGPVRDYVLGARLLTGDGRVLRFGGEVMKNVAGYDVARLLAGSLGILGVILDVSLKVLPLRTDTHGAARLRRGLARSIRSPQTRYQRRRSRAAVWCADQLRVRLEGSAFALNEIVPSARWCNRRRRRAPTTYWRDVRDQRHDFFAGAPDALARQRAVARIARCGRRARALVARMERRPALVRGCCDAASSPTLARSRRRLRDVVPFGRDRPPGCRARCSRRCRRR